MLVPPRGSPPTFRTETIHEHKSKVRSVAQYWERAAEFDALAVTATVEGLRKRYSDIAACYRLLAKEREWLVGRGAIEGEPRIGHALLEQGDVLVVGHGSTLMSATFLTEVGLFILFGML
ncbi:hypothetical protein KIP88_41905 [Bradyrhizobium sp. SRL28]|uniref:hypothetical protein n=1 Tax=Bradyrhizobium sp. SRL28 TaxID=2836178 RepID=UPI001BDE3FCF|nr:hypothetical protein [Bradyrhizobium sp. SRL28]MBT1516949.1 hypothetical protein [Bradyrhizobium sp. SRL28]